MVVRIYVRQLVRQRRGNEPAECSREKDWAVVR